MKVICLGTGAAQVDLAEYLRERGHYIIGMSNSASGPALPLMHKFILCDITDIEQIYSHAKELHVDLVLSIGSDMALPAMTEVSRRLSLPCLVNPAHLKICLNKANMRKWQTENNFNVPEYIQCSSLNESLSFSHFPAVIKPVDSQGQRGVFLVNSPDELTDMFPRAQKYSGAGPVIVEEYIPGDEYSVNCVVQDGELIFISVTERRPSPMPSFGQPERHRIPANNAVSIRKVVAKELNRIIDRLQIVNAPLYLQVKLHEGKVYIIEMSPRLDGCHLWRLIEESCGADILDMYVEQTNGRRFDSAGLGAVDYCACEMLFYYQPDGQEFTGTKQLRDADIIFTRDYYQISETVRAQSGKYAKTAYTIIRPEQ